MQATSMIVRIYCVFSYQAASSLVHRAVLQKIDQDQDQTGQVLPSIDDVVELIIFYQLQHYENKRKDDHQISCPSLCACAL